MPKLSRNVLVLVVAALPPVLIGGPIAVAAPLDAQQQSLLEDMHAEAVAQCLATVERAIAWRQQVQTTVAQLKQAGNDPSVVVSLAPLETVLQEIELAKQQLPAKAQQLIGQVQAVRQVIAAAEAEWQNAPFDPQKFPDLTEPAFREQAKREAYAKIADRLSMVVDQELLSKIERLRDPAGYARGYLEGEFRNFLAGPRPVGNSGLVIKVLPPPAGTSIFSPAAKLGVEIEYLPQSLSVKATGLWFKYDGDGIPEIVTTDLAVDPSENLKGRALSGLKSLGKEITEDMNLPLGLTITGLPDFKTAKPGGLEFALEIGILGEETVKAKAEQLMLYPNGEIDWKQGTLKIDYPLPTPVPLGTTPFGMFTIGGDYGAKTRALGVEARISALAPGAASAIALKGRVETQIPMKSIGIKGTLLLMETIDLATAEAKIDFTKGILSGSFKAGNSIPGIPFGVGQGSFELKKEQLTMDGSIELYGRSVARADIVVNFSDQSAKVAIDSGLNLFGVDFADTWEGEIRPGFKSIRFTGTQSIKVPGIDPYGDIYATVSVSADTAEGRQIRIEVDTFIRGLDVSVTVGDFDECTMGNLRKWIQDKAVDAYHQFLKGLAQADEDGREWAARVDKKTRDYVSSRLGFTWSSGNEELDKFGGQIAQGVQNLGGAVSGLVQQGGGALGNLNQGAQDILSGKPPW